VPALRDRRHLLVLALVAVHVIYPAAIILGSTLNTPGFHALSDAAGFHRLATHAGRPYVDFEAPYPPLAIGIFKLLGPASFRGWAVHLLLLQAGCDGVIAFALWWARGVPALVRYLGLSAPLLPFVLMKYDLLPTAVAVVATVVVARRERLAGVLLGASVFLKVWTAALVFGFAARRQRAAFRAAVTTLGAGVAAWCWWARGLGGVRQVMTFRGAKGWHVESGPGVLLELMTRGRLHGDGGAWRVGAPPGAANAALTVLLVGAISLVWWRVAHSAGRHEIGVAESAAVAALLVFAPLLSPQFLIWLVPWLALAGAAGERTIERLGGAAIVLATIVLLLSEPKHADMLWVQFVLLARNGLLLGVFVHGVRRLGTKADATATASFATMGRDRRPTRAWQHS
jgi:hypothetical protein